MGEPGQRSWRQRGSALVADQPPRDGGSLAAGRQVEPRRVQRRRRREVTWIVLGVCVAAACALGFAVALSSVGAQTQVLVAARDVPAGHVFTADDLRIATVSSTGLSLRPASDEGSVVGHVAAARVPAGAPLVNADVGAADLPAGEAVVAILCHPGQFPPDLASGQRVHLVADAAATSAPADSTGPTTPTSTDGVVLGVDSSQDPSASGTVITVQVADADAAAIAQAGGAGHVSLVVVRSGS